MLLGALFISLGFSCPSVSVVFPCVPIIWNISIVLKHRKEGWKIGRVDTWKLYLILCYCFFIWQRSWMSLWRGGVTTMPSWAPIVLSYLIFIFTTASSKFYKKWCYFSETMPRWYWKPIITLCYEETISISPYFFPLSWESHARR